MGSVTGRNDLADLLNSPENAQRLNGLVEDVRYALVEYQVRAPDAFTLVASNICLRVLHNKTPTTRAVSSP